MRILHTSDWHLGRSFHGESLLAEQRQVVERLVDMTSDHGIDLVVIAGDLYDRAIPPTDAVRLFDDALVALHEAGASVVAITGNHQWSSHRLKAFIEDATAAATRESDATAERQTAADEIERRDGLNTTAAEHERRRDSAAEALRGARSAAEQMVQLEDAAIRAIDRADAAAELQSLRPAQRAAEEALESAEETTQARRADWLDLRERYLDEIAAELAGSLETDKPCPVCGSTDHPDPTQPASDFVASEQVESAEAEFTAATEAEDAAQEALRLIDSQIAELTGRAGAAADDPDAAHEAAADAAGARDTARRLAEQVPALAEAMETHENAASDAEEQARQAEQAATAANERANEAENAAGALRKRIQDSIGRVDPATAISKIAEIDTALGEVRSAALTGC